MRCCRAARRFLHRSTSQGAGWPRQGPGEGWIGTGASTKAMMRASPTPVSMIPFGASFRFPTISPSKERSPRDNPGGTSNGFYPGGIGWYRMHLTAGPDWTGRRIILTLDGVMMRSTVFFNGTEVATNPYGYLGTIVDVTAHVRPGADNVIAVRADNARMPSGRWVHRRRDQSRRVARRARSGPSHARRQLGQGPYRPIGCKRNWSRSTRSVIRVPTSAQSRCKRFLSMRLGER